MVPNWLKSYLSDDGSARIQKAIEQAESKTSGEVVPMIVRASSTVGHVPPMMLAILVIAFLLVDGFELQANLLGDHPLLILVDMIVLILLANGLAQLTWVQRLLTSRADRIAQSETRAELEFYEAELNRTKDATGILLFVSLMEHRVTVLADKGISEKVPAETWTEVDKLIISGIKSKDMAKGFESAILKCGEILAPHFPIQPDDKNELSDKLIIKE